jgi:hypothetical protein
MYSSSRQTSQGNERLHNVCDTPHKALHKAPHKAPHKNKFRSRFAWTEDDDEDEEEDDTIMDMHILTDGLEDTPYYSGRVATLMRSVTEQDADE